MGASCSCAANKDVYSHEKKGQDPIVDAPRKKKVYRDEQSVKKKSQVDHDGQASENAHTTKKEEVDFQSHHPPPKNTPSQISETPKDEHKLQPSTTENIKKTNDHQENTKESVENHQQPLKENIKQQLSQTSLKNESSIEQMSTASIQSSHDLKKVDSVAFSSFVKSLLPNRFTFSAEVDKKDHDQLEFLSSYLPQQLLYHLEDSESTDLVTGTSYETCVLMIDISGFTPLTESLSKQPNGVELLTKYINSYFSGLIEYIYSYSGDIEKFAGDAIICQFCNRKGQNKSLKELVLSAMECALSIQKNEKLRVFKVNDSISLQIHCGISIGSLSTHHIGGVSNYYLRISAGQALLDMGSALGNSKVGELCLTKEAYEIVKNSCTCKKVEGIEDDVYLAVDLSDTIVEKSNLEPVNITPTLSQAIKQFVSPSVRTKIIAGQQDWLNEIKPLSIGFLSLIDSNTYASVAEANLAYQDYISLVQNILEKYEGFIANLLSDEKGTILVFCFGYPFTHSNDPLRAVKAGIEIREQLSELGIKGGLGISTGKCFIGNVGSKYRKEFTIYGDKVNLSARLMKESEKHEGMVLCEEDTYSRLKGVQMELLDPIKVKGKSNLINICKVLNGELSSKQTYYNAKKAGSEMATEQDDDTDDRVELVGRENVMNAIGEIIATKIKEFEDPNTPKQASKVITIKGDVGVGKTDLLTRLSEIWKTKIATVYISPPQFETPFYSMQSNIKICFCEIIAKKKNVELDYPNVEKIYKTLTVQEKEEAIRDKVNDETDLSYMYLLNNVFGVKFKSNGELLSKEQIINISAGIMSRFLITSWVSMGYGSQPWFMLTDDFQYGDPFSRKLISLFLEGDHPLTQTLLIVMASRIMDKDDSEVKDIEEKRADFECWSERAELVINLKPFSRLECGEYLKKFYKATEVNPEALEFVYEKSQGNQMLTKAICTFLKENNKHLIEDGTLRLKYTALEGEILATMSSYTQRKIDRLDDEAKITLKIASVCGLDFDLNTIESVFPSDSPIKREGNIQQLLTTLFVNDLLVKSGSHYKFRSSLIHSIVYESVPKDQKREIHLKLANLFTDKIENENTEEVDQCNFLTIVSLHYAYYYDDIILEETLNGDPLEKETELYNLCFAYHLIEKSLSMQEKQSNKFDTIKELGLANVRILENAIKYWREISTVDHMNSPRLKKSLTVRDFIKNTKELCDRRFEDLTKIDSTPYIFATSLYQMKENLARHLLQHSLFIQKFNVGDSALKAQSEDRLRKGLTYCPPENRELLFFLHGQQWFLKFIEDKTDEALAYLPTLSEIASNNSKLIMFSEISAVLSHNTRGSFDKVSHHANRVMEIYWENPEEYSQYSIENFRNIDAYLLACTFNIRALQALGKNESARMCYEKGMKRSMEVNHPQSLTFFLAFCCYYLLQSEQLEELEKVTERGIHSLSSFPQQTLLLKFYSSYVKIRHLFENNDIVCHEKDTELLSLINKMESLYAAICHYNSPSLIINFAILECKLKYLALIVEMGETKCPSISGLVSSFHSLMDQSLKSNQENLLGELWRLKGEMKIVEKQLKLVVGAEEQYLSSVEQCYTAALNYVNQQNAYGLKLRILTSYLKSLQSLQKDNNNNLIQSTTIDSLMNELNSTFQHIETPSTYSNKDIERYSLLNNNK